MTSRPERNVARRQHLLARGPRLSWSIADYLPPDPREPSSFPYGHREGVSPDPNLNLWYAWMSDDNYTLTFGPFETEAEARHALAYPETWA